MTAVQSKDDDSSISVDALSKAFPMDALCGTHAGEQDHDLELLEIERYIKWQELPEDDWRPQRIAIQWDILVMEENILYYLDPKEEHRKRQAVPCHFRQCILPEHHSLALSGHFSGKMYGALAHHWWWDGM